MSEPLLGIRGVGKRFGHLTVLDDVSFDLYPGRVHALIGPNGAGKTTLLNIVSGYLAADRGRIVLGPTPLEGYPASARVGLGLGRTFQIVQLFGHMTVLENVLTGLHRHVRQTLWSALLGLGAFRTEEARLRQTALDWLAAVGLGDYAGRRAGELPYGLQRRLEVARALATGPRVLLLDEPAAGLSAPEAEELGALLARLGRDGMCLLIVEHNVPFVTRIAEHVVVLDAGQVIAEGPPVAVQNDPRVIEAYLGEMQYEPA